MGTIFEALARDGRRHGIWVDPTPAFKWLLSVLFPYLIHARSAMSPVSITSITFLPRVSGPCSRAAAQQKRDWHKALDAAGTQGTARCGDCESAFIVRQIDVRLTIPLQCLTNPSQKAARDPSCFSPWCMSGGAVAMPMGPVLVMRPGRVSGTLRSEGAVPCSSPSRGDFCRKWGSF